MKHTSPSTNDIFKEGTKWSELIFDKNTYEREIFESIIEQKAKETENKLSKEREMIKSWKFEISRENIANWNNERMELINHINFLESKSSNKAEKKLYKKMQNILEEMAKNVQKDKYYMEEWENKENKKYERWEVKIIKNDDYITISTSNYTKDEVERIPEKLENLNKLTDLELKELYKDRLSNHEFSKRWWAWLWFIDMRRKSWGWKIECTINPTESPEIKQINFSISIPIESTSEEKEVNAA